MRGNPDPAPAGDDGRLTAVAADRDSGPRPRVLPEPGRDADPELVRRLLAATGVLLLLAAVTGATASPLLLLLVPALSALVRYEPRPIVLMAPPAAAVLLAVIGAWRGQGALVTVASALMLVIAALPGLWWRREARRSARRLQRLDDILLQARTGREEEAATAANELADLERALAAVAGRVGAVSVLLWSADGQRGMAHPRAGAGGRMPAAVRLSGDPLGWAWDNAMRLRLEQAPRWADSGLAVVVEPLRRAEDAGELVTYAFLPGTLPDDAVFDEAGIYMRAVLGLQEARVEAAADRRRLRSLMQVLGRPPAEQDLETFAPELCATAAGLVDGTGAAIGVWHGDHGTVLAAWGDDGGPGAGDIFGPPAAELALAIRADTMLVRTAADWSLGRTHVAHAHERWNARPRALAALPLRAVDGVIGVLAVWSSRVPALDPDLLHLLSAIAPYTAVHLHHAREYGTIKETAERDPLTQLRNRRAFERVFTAETARFDRYRRPISLLVLDLDHFKGVNDRFGHEAGDEVLRRTARILQNVIRDVDIAARLGGEEFVVLMPETPLKAALEVAERIRAAIAASPVAWQGGSIPVHVSIGVSTAPELVAAPAGLMASADAALYAAKAGGRNRVVAGERTG